MEPSSIPEILLFKRFKAFWTNIVVLITSLVLKLRSLQRFALCDVSDEVMDFAINQLELIRQCDDYNCELIELAVMFLG